MLQIGKYVRPASVQEAYELLQKGRANRVMGGGIWLRLQDRRIPTVIDLSELDLDHITRVRWDSGRISPEGDAFSIGCMVTLRQLERNRAFKNMTCHVFEQAVQDIVGIQMRNLATVGGSLYGRFGFSDVLTSLLALDCDVEFAGAGRMPLAEWAKMDGYPRDILVRVIVRDHAYKARYQRVVRSATDFPVLNVCAAQWDEKWHIAIGARPTRAILVQGDEIGLPGYFTTEQLDAACKKIAELPMGGNMRGSEEYRRHLAEVLSRRAILGALNIDDEILAQQSPFIKTNAAVAQAMQADALPVKDIKPEQPSLFDALEGGDA